MRRKVQNTTDEGKIQYLYQGKVNMVVIQSLQYTYVYQGGGCRNSNLYMSVNWEG